MNSLYRWFRFGGRLCGLALISLVGSGEPSFVSRAAAAPPQQGRTLAELLGGQTPKSPKERAISRQLALAEYYIVQERDLNAGASELRKLLQLDPGNLKAGMLLTRVYLAQNDGKKALQTLERLAKKNQDNGQVWRLLGASKLAAGDTAGGIAAVKKALQIDPADAESHFILFGQAYVRYKAGDASAKPAVLAAAQGYLASTRRNKSLQYRLVERTLLELVGDPIDVVVYDARADYEAAFLEERSELIAERMGRAAKGFARCVEAQPQNQRCHYYLGLIYSSVKAMQQYNLQQAKQELALAPEIPDAQVELAMMLRHEDDLPGADKACKRALEVRPNYSRALLEQGIVAKLDDREEDAVRAFVSAFQADPVSATGSKAVDELAKIRPDHPLVRTALALGLEGSSDVFSTARFQAAVSLIEKRLGGAEENAPEEAVLREIVARLLRGSDLTQAALPRVIVLGSPVVNAMALPNGNVYVTRGMLSELKKLWPARPIDANHGPLAHILAHELAHVVRRHGVQSALFREAIKDAEAPLDPAVLTYTTRLQETEADRLGIVMAFLASYPPRGALEVMETMGQKQEIPGELDHPTFDERVHYLEEYWSNDVKYAYQSFRGGVSKLDQAEKLEASDPGKALELYKDSLDDFRRFRDTLKPTKEILNNMGIAYAKIGVVGQTGSPLQRWQTPFSIERETALKYAGLAAESGGKTRGGGNSGGTWQLRQAMLLFQEALGKDPDYRRASINLAITHIALGAPDKAVEILVKLPPLLGRDAAELYSLLGVAQGEAGRAKEAEKALRDSLAASPDAPAPLFNLARLYQKSGRKADAQAAFRSYLQKTPTGAWAEVAKRELAAQAP